MAESMVGLKRTHRCTEVSAANIGESGRTHFCGFKGQKWYFTDFI